MLLMACPAPPPAGDDNENDDVDNDDDDDLTGQAVFDYVPLDGTVCANGTPAGYGVSAHDNATSLVVFLNGGGACWDDFSCFGLNAATHLSTTYSASVLESDMRPLLDTGIVDRGDEASPFRRATFAFVPYCTADLHNGSAERSYQTDIFGTRRAVHHRGRDNLVHIVADLAARFATVDEVFVMGASAGGYGAVLNVDLFDNAFPLAEIHVLVDGAPFVQPQNGLFGTWNNQWSMTLPPEAACADCRSDFAAIVGHHHANMPGSRFALITTTGDETIRTYFGYGLDQPRFTTEVNRVVDAHYLSAGHQAFVVDSTAHVLIGGYTSFAAGGVTLRSFVDGWARGDAGFTTRR